VSAPQAADGWETAIRDIAASPVYGNLKVRPQIGLLPIGTEEPSGLWMFWHPETGRKPERGARGEFVPKDATGLVFVLLPGGTFRKGAQRSDAGAPNHDPDALPAEGPVTEVAVEPFFLSKYELTQAQYWLLCGQRPSLFCDNHYYDHWNKDHEPWSGMHPVERISWIDCLRHLPRVGLTLPTDEQWEYAYRAGADTPFPMGGDRRTLLGYGNLCDAYCMKFAVGTFETWLDDGNRATARIGRYLPNKWGFHDMVGNVSEWVFDRELPRPGDRTGPAPATARVAGDRRIRGGNFESMAQEARAARFGVVRADALAPQIGVRPARVLER